MRDIGQFYVISVEGVTRADGTLLQSPESIAPASSVPGSSGPFPTMALSISTVRLPSVAQPAAITSQSAAHGEELNRRSDE
jgi:hypothetical protein